MKTMLSVALAVVLAAATLTFGAPVPPISAPAIAGGSGPDTWCGAPVCQTPRPPWTIRGR